MDIGDRKVTSIIEYLVLAIVLLATISLNQSAVESGDDELELTHISGEMTLSTRGSMDALGLNEFERGAHARVDLNVHPIISEGCIGCYGVPKGMKLNGTVIITDLIDEAGRLGRVEATIDVIYLYDSISPGFIAKEWVSFDWDAGPASVQWELIISHQPPRWNPEVRDNAAFITIEGGLESRNGPWLLVKEMFDYTREIKGCIPTSFTCDATTVPEFNFTNTFEGRTTPIEITHPATWAPIQIMPSNNNTPVLMEGIRGQVAGGQRLNDSVPWCSTEINADVIASWEMSAIEGVYIAPMSAILTGSRLPSGSFTPSDGVWTEVENDSESCASALDKNGDLILGIHKING